MWVSNSPAATAPMYLGETLMRPNAPMPTWGTRTRGIAEIPPMLPMFDWEKVGEWGKEVAAIKLVSLDVCQAFSNNIRIVPEVTLRICIRIRDCVNRVQGLKYCVKLWDLRIWFCVCVCVCVCMCERERERERETKCACVCMHQSMCLRVYQSVSFSIDIRWLSVMTIPKVLGASTHTIPYHTPLCFVTRNDITI